MSGSMLPLVFVHGASSDETVWAAQQAYFEKMTDVIAVNLTAYDSVADMSAHVLARAPEEFALCGTSMGGYVALDVLKKANGRVKRAILCNTSARADTPEKTRLRMMDVAAGEDAYMNERQDDEHYKVFVSEKSFADKALIARLREISKRVGYGCFSRHQTACSTRPESLGFLPQVNMPVLLIGGAEDKITPPELQKEIQENIKGARFTLLPDVGHIAHMEAAEAVTREIEQFMRAA